MRVEKKSRRYWLSALVIFGSFTFLALLFTPQTYLVNEHTPRPLSWGEAFAANAVLFYTWALLTPIALWLGKHLPIERPKLLRNVLVLFVLGIPFALTHIYLLKFFNQVFLGAMMQEYRSPVPIEALLVGLGATNYIIYSGILISSQAINYFARYKERDYRLMQSQFQALKMQLHPHFLFNTLNAISELVYDSPEVADRTISKLSDLLRLSLKSSRAEEVSLKEEIDFLQKYLEIQQTLLQERLSVEMKIDSEVLDAGVPNMILQPLVENAIRHGIAPRATGGRIQVCAQREKNQLYLTVRDNGLGLMPEFSLESKKSKEGIGLSNTRARLKHLYGDAHQFDLVPTPEGGLTVNMIIPFREILVEEHNEDSHPDR